MKYNFLLIVLTLLPGLSMAQTTIPADDPRLVYCGRIDFSNPKAPHFDWPGVSILFHIQGPSVDVLMEDAGNNWDVQVDGKSVTVWVTSRNRQSYALEGLGMGSHQVRLVKRTEATFGTVVFKGLVLAEGVSLDAPPALPRRKLEVVGDSIVCGYGVESDSVQCKSLRPYENADKAFGTLTALDLEAQYHLVAFSGKGVVRNWGEKKPRSPDPFPPFYGRTLCQDAQSRWDFNRWTPDAVVVHLGSNDFSTEPQADPKDYIEHYLDLLRTIRGFYPKAALFCVCPLGWPNFYPHVKEVVQTLNGAGDNNIYLVGYPNYPSTELGCDGHPNAVAQRQMADVLVPVLREKLGWK